MLSAFVHTKTAAMHFNMVGFKHGRGKLDVELMLGYRGYWVRAQGKLKLMFDKVTTHVYNRQLLLVLKNLGLGMI